MKSSLKFLGLILALAFLGISASCQKKTAAESQPPKLIEAKIDAQIEVPPLIHHPKRKKVVYKKMAPRKMPLPQKKIVKRQRPTLSQDEKMKLVGWWSNGTGGKAIRFYSRGTYDHFKCEAGKLYIDGPQGRPYSMTAKNELSLSYLSVFDEAKGTIEVVTSGVFTHKASEAEVKAACP